MSSCFKIHPLLCVYPTSQLGWAWCTEGMGFCPREGSGEWQACSGVCVSETQGQASCRGRGKEPRLLPSGEGQWVEPVNIADSQTGSGGQTEEKKGKQPKECMPQVPGPEAWGFCRFPAWFPKTWWSVRSRLKNRMGDALTQVNHVSWMHVILF